MSNKSLCRAQYITGLKYNNIETITTLIKIALINLENVNHSNILEQSGLISDNICSWYKTQLNHEEGCVVFNKSDFNDKKVNMIIDTINSSLYWKDKDGCYLNCNKYFLDVFELSNKEAIIGKTDYDLFPKNIADAIREIDLYVIKHGSYCGEEYYNINNKEIIVLTSKKAGLTIMEVYGGGIFLDQ